MDLKSIKMKCITCQIPSAIPCLHKFRIHADIANYRPFVLFVLFKCPTPITFLDAMIQLHLRLNGTIFSMNNLWDDGTKEQLESRIPSKQENVDKQLAICDSTGNPPQEDISNASSLCIRILLLVWIALFVIKYFQIFHLTANHLFPITWVQSFS